MKFCENILVIKISGEHIFFTDETKIELLPFLNDSIRLSMENQKKIKMGEEEAFKLMNKQEKNLKKV